MKRFITVLILVVCIVNVKAQTYVTIPDANFVIWLQNNIPSAMSGNQMDITSPAILNTKNITVDLQNISDLTGIEYFISLDTLNCNVNSLTNLPILPNTLVSLYCGHNQLSSLPTLPNSLKSLNCTDNKLTSLPNLPTNLKELLCRQNLLTNLPIFPDSMTLLECSSNQITSLPNLPNQLSYLNCSYNQLTTLPSLPNTLMTILCSYNNISCFPIFPIIYKSTNPFISSGIDISFNPFTCLPNYVPVMDAATLNYPLCVAGNTVTNPNGCANAKGISGTVFRDINLDCIKNIGESGIINATMKLYDNANTFLGLTTTYNNGLYFFNDTMGTYHIVLDTLAKPYMVQCANPGIDSLVTLTPTYTLEDSVDFAVTCKPGFDLTVQSIYRNGLAFPGLTHTLTVVAGDISQWNNLNCAAGISGTVSFSVNGSVTYIGPASGALTPNVTGNVYTYTIADFGTINNTSDFKLVFLTNTTAQTGDLICVNATVTPIGGDYVPINNALEFCYPITNSHDPNIKEVYPIEVQPGFNDWLTYTIHFQNTGNAAAINIRLEDTLDNRLDPETFQVLNYSHSNTIDLTGHHLTVRYPNIQLADSTTNRQGSVGFVQYRIKPKAGWITDTIKNKVAIYFDYNAPVITNTAKSYFMLPTAINELMVNHSSVNLLPNPTNGLVTIQSSHEMQQIEVSNVAGQMLLSESLNTKSHQLQLQNFAEGIYFVKIFYADEKSVMKKVIKQ